MTNHFVYGYHRKPAKRERGQYCEIPDGLREFAQDTAYELCEKYQDIDILDLEIMFTDQFRLALRMDLLKGNAVEA